jgi:hypothetical protein
VKFITKKIKLMTLRLRMEDVKNFKLIVKNYGQKQERAKLFRHCGVVLLVPL